MYSDDSQKFADYLCERLTTNSLHYSKLAVFRYEDDVPPGRRECGIFSVV